VLGVNVAVHSLREKSSGVRILKADQVACQLIIRDLHWGNVMMCVGIAQLDRAAILVDAGANYVVPDFRPLSYSKLQQMFVQ
jgi:hypothetical protein